MKKFNAIVFLSLLACLFAAGCADEQKTMEPALTDGSFSEDQNQPPGASDFQAESAPESSTIALVNDQKVTRKEVEEEMQNLLMQFQNQIPPDQMNDARAGLWNQAIENMINRNLLLQEANQENIEVEDSKVQDQYKQILSRFPSEENFLAFLQQRNITKDELLENIRMNLKIETLVAEKTESTEEITEEAISEFYNSRPEMFEQPAQVKASHILLRTGNEQEDKAQKKAELEEIKEKIEGGADFAEMARQYSDCPSKSKGGDLGFFGKGAMVKPFEETAFHLDVGEMSDIVETNFGYHLIKVTDKKEEKTLTLAESTERIKKMLQDQKQNDRVRNYLENLRDQAEIEYVDKTISSNLS